MPKKEHCSLEYIAVVHECIIHKFKFIDDTENLIKATFSKKRNMINLNEVKAGNTLD